MNSITLKNSLHSKLDLIGTFLSLACAVHCVLIPILVVVLPLVGLSFFLSATVEKVFVIASIALAAFNLCWGYRVHKKIRTLLIFFAASAMIISGIFILPHSHDLDHEMHVHQQTVHSGVIQAEHGITTNLKDNAKRHRPQDNPLGLVLLVTGAAAIAISHILNRRLCKSCQNCNTLQVKKDCQLYL